MAATGFQSGNENAVSETKSQEQNTLSHNEFRVETSGNEDTKCEEGGDPDAECLDKDYIYTQHVGSP
ncbi:hypothetical protein SUGI_0363660 [Cryptomeria japonica]|nr:hypothetical protein SUGI_0363660 [Cryptomeria japonica]